MATPFDVPGLDDLSKAIGVKNSGVKEFTHDRVFPVTRLVSQDGTLTSGKVWEARFRSDSSRWINWRESKLNITYEVLVTNNGATPGTAPGVAVAIPATTRMTALPGHAIFNGGMRYTLNSTVVENNVTPYQSAMVALLTRTDTFDTQTSGSNALMTLDKRVGFDKTAAAGEDARLTNPKCEVLQSFLGADNKAIFEVSEPLVGLASLQHGYFAPPGDHRLEFTVANNFEQNLIVNNAATANGQFETISSAVIPAVADRALKTCYINCTSIELSIAMAGPATPFIPRSLALKFSPYMITTKSVQTKTVLDSVTVPSSCRAIYLWLQQASTGGRLHDFEEMGLATAGINIKTAANNDANQIGYFESLEVQIGSHVAGKYTALNPIQGKMSKPWDDAMSVQGKPNAMRGSTMTYAQYCGQHNSNAASGPLSAIASRGDVAGGFYMRIINPSGSLSNICNIRGELSQQPGTTADLQLVVVAVSDRLLECEYSEGQEIPSSTRVSDIL